tara:strand:- start:2680 stop:3720 length:1041 start_codon:yes stop_codon:yes gene_type:complete
MEIGINNTEPHIIILWQPEDFDRVQSVIRSKFRLVRTFEVPCLLENLGDAGRHQIMDALYRYDGSTAGTKGMKPFHVFIIEDDNPIYAIRDATRVTKPVNLNMYDLKHLLRQGRSGYLHATDNLEEVHDNLQVLSHLMDDTSIYDVWKNWRPKFNNMTEYFDKLHSNDKLEYVIMRNFDHYPESVVVDEHTDIDILVNDYFLFKSLVGGKNRKKPAYEDGGFKVANLVQFADKEVTNDTRFIGDNYYCKSWQKDMLKNRKLHNGFYIMDDKNHFYSLLYHALIHKQDISNTYIKTFLELGLKLGVNINNNNVHQRDHLKLLLDVFMHENGYEYVKASDQGVFFNRN